MRIALVTVGTTGDLVPYLALAKGLLARGHEAYLVSQDLYQASAQAHGVPMRSFGEIPRAELQSVVERLVTERNVLKHPGIIADAHARGRVAEIGQATIAATADADLIVSHSLALMGAGAAEVHRIPLVNVHLFPNLIKSQRMTPGGASYGRALNALSWVVGRYVVRRSADPALNEVFRHFGLRERSEAMLSTGGSAMLNIVAISPNVLPLDPAWPENYRVAGYLFLEEPGFSPDEELSDFLRNGDPPVVITFGSLAGIDGARMMRTLAAAASIAGCRAIVQTGWQDLGSEPLPAGMIRVGYVPHGWLFAQAKCVISHGGAGTTAAALRAGVPPITLHHYGDQLFWGLQTARLGVAPRPLSSASLRASSLAQRIGTATRDRVMREKARALGERIRAEDGVANAVKLIEHAMAHRQR
jgi:sterol 3beta-glucosyltransferase